MKTMIKIIISLLLIGSISNCEREFIYKRYSIYLKNNAEHSISLYFALGGKFGNLYPDTTLPKTKQYMIPGIKPNSIYTYHSGIKWEEIYSKLPKDTLSVYIFHTDTLNKYTWEEVRNGYMILKRYDLSLEDLKSMNWTITYP